MAQIIKGDGYKEHYERKKPESTQIKQFNTFDECLDFLFALKIKPKKTTIWPYFDKWTMSINYK